MSPLPQRTREVFTGSERIEQRAWRRLSSREGRGPSGEPPPRREAQCDRYQLSCAGSAYLGRVRRWCEPDTLQIHRLPHHYAA